MIEVNYWNLESEKKRMNWHRIDWNMACMRMRTALALMGAMVFYGAILAILVLVVSKYVFEENHYEIFLCAYWFFVFVQVASFSCSKKFRKFVFKSFEPWKRGNRVSGN